MATAQISQKLRLALRSGLFGFGSTGWLSPKRRRLARLAIMISAVCLGAAVGAIICIVPDPAVLAPIIAAVVLSGLGFLAYDVIMSLEMIEKEGYEAEMRIAREIQTRLLPRKLPSGEGLSFAVYHAPARAVGGDYYDVIPLWDDCYSVVIADVSGKGVPAAILMASVRAQIRALAQRGLVPATLVSYVNENLFQDTEVSQYVTLFYGRIDPNKGILEYANAGHETPFAVSNEGLLRRLELGGLPLGMFSGTEYEQGVVPFSQGDRLVLYTDGVIDVGETTGRFLEPESIQKVVTENRHDTVRRLVEFVIEKVDALRSSDEQADDITLLVVGADSR